MLGQVEITPFHWAGFIVVVLLFLAQNNDNEACPVKWRDFNLTEHDLRSGRLGRLKSRHFTGQASLSLFCFFWRWTWGCFIVALTSSGSRKRSPGPWFGLAWRWFLPSPS